MGTRRCFSARQTRLVSGNVPRMRGSLWVLPGYLVATVLFLWPLMGVFTGWLPAVYAAHEPLHQAFFLGWDLQALATQPWDVFRAPIFYPAPRALTYMDHLLGEAILAWPVAALTGNLAIAYNAILGFSFVASAWATYRLARFLSISTAGSFLCGFLYAFAPYRFSNLGELNQLQTQFLPLGLWLALRFARRRRSGDLFGAAATLAAQGWFGWYGAVHLGVSLAVLALYAAVAPGMRRGNVPWPRVALAAAVAAAMILPVATPYVLERRSDSGARRTLGEAALYSADLLDYMRVNRENWALAGAGWPAGDQGYWPGVVTVAFAIVGALALRARPPAGGEAIPFPSERRFFALLAASGVVLSLGPVLHVAGRTLPVPLPYAALHFAPLFSGMRAPGRFTVVALLGLAMLAGIGYEELRRRLRPSRRAILSGIALGVAGLTSYSAPFPLVRLPGRASMPAVYQWIGAQPGRFAVLELPMPASERDEGVREATRMIYALYHGKPILDGLASYVPPATRRLREAMQRFPQPAAVTAAARMGARTLVVHYGEIAAAERDEIRRRASAAPGLRAITSFGHDVVYEIVPAP